jgi:hypothetical protein
MLYREMPKTKDKLSILGFGCMRLPWTHMNVDEEETIEQLRYAINKGINYMDTAWPYHNRKSEVILGKVIKDGYRNRVKIADKLPHWLCKTREDMDYYLNSQLQRLNEEVIDYYLIHGLDAESWKKVKALGVVDFMNKAKVSGKIINAGFSFHGIREDFNKIIDDYDWGFYQIHFNIGQTLSSWCGRTQLCLFQGYWCHYHGASPRRFPGRLLWNSPGTEPVILTFGRVVEVKRVDYD